MRRGLVVAAVLAAFGVGTWLSGMPARFGLGQTPSALLSKRRGARLPQAVSVEPYGLNARVPAEWTCRHGYETACFGTDYNVEWKVERVERVGHARDFASFQHAEGVTELHEYELSLEVAGFRGYVVSWYAIRGGGKGCTFRGWRTDDARGILRLQIEGSEGCRPELIDVIASTTGPEHLPAWADDTTRKRQAPLVEAMADLADDAKPPHVWASALWKLTAKESADLVGPMRERKNPSVTELVKRRIETASRGKSAEEFGYAVSLSAGLEAWEPKAFPSVLEALAKRATERAVALRSESTREANRARDFDCRLADNVAQRRSDPAIIRALVERLSSLDIDGLTASFDCPSTLFRHRQLAEARALLEKRYAPENVPANVDWLELASFTTSRAKESSLMKRHVLSMLGNERPADAQLVVKGRGFEIHSKRSSGGGSEWVGKGVPSDGTKISLRVCDVYAFKADAVAPYRPEAERDRGIKQLVLRLKELPDKAP
jgi:hypothetical protein